MSAKNIAAIYCRLSKDDEQSGDSVSIETQKMMLTKYCREQNFDVFDIYIDDGYSGLNFNRPSFSRLIDDLEADKFDIVVTKDLSRLGRDYIQTGYYIDVYFSIKRIRYIAVNDGIDTKYNDNDIAPFKNILNDMYAKDLSRKIKSAKLQRAQNGLYISSQPPFGYKVNPYNRNQLIIDEEAAQVVKLIFDLAEEGKSYSEISRILEAREIVSPSVYKTMNGDTRFLKITDSRDRKYKWSYQTIKAIITNIVYVGDMVNHKVETVNYKTKERVRVPSEEQIVVRNRHDAIIDRDRFELINARFSNRRKANHKLENIFKGVIYCSECGEELQLILRKLKNETCPMFRCVKHIVDKQVCQHYHFVYHDDLCKEIEKQLATRITEIVNSSKYDDLCKQILLSIGTRTIEMRKSELQKELICINQKIKKCYREIPLNTDDSTHLNRLDQLYNLRKKTMQQITEISDSNTQINQRDLDNIKKNVCKYLFPVALSEKTIKLFIKRIEIGHLERTPNNRHQRIKIYYNF